MVQQRFATVYGHPLSRTVSPAEIWVIGTLLPLCVWLVHFSFRLDILLNPVQDLRVGRNIKHTNLE